MVTIAQKCGLRSKAPKKGVLAKGHLDAILKSPFYYGMMEMKGTLYEHKYPRLISKQLFNQCEQVRRGKNYPPRQCRQESVLRGLVRCAVTGRVITPDPKRKYVQREGMEVTYHYLGVPRPENTSSKIYVEESTVLEQLQDVFRNIRMPDEVYADLLEDLRSSSEAEKVHHAEMLKSLQREEVDIQGRLDRLMDLLLAGKITIEDHDRKRSQLKLRQFEVNEQLRHHHQADDSFRDTIAMILGIARKAYELFESSNTAEKRQLINLMFSNLELKGTKLCYTLQKPFDQFVNIPDRQGWWAVVDDLRTDRGWIQSLKIPPAYQINQITTALYQ